MLDYKGGSDGVKMKITCLVMQLNWAWLLLHSAVTQINKGEKQLKHLNRKREPKYIIY